MRHESGRLKDVQSRTNCVMIDGVKGVLRMAQVGWTLATVLRSSGRSLLLTVFNVLQEEMTCSMESSPAQSEHAGLLSGWTRASLSLVR